MAADPNFPVNDSTAATRLFRQCVLAGSYKFHEHGVCCRARLERVVAMYPSNCIRAQYTFAYAEIMTLARESCLSRGLQGGLGFNIELHIRREEWIRAPAVTVRHATVFGHVRVLHTHKRERNFLQKAMVECFRSGEPM